MSTAALIVNPNSHKIWGIECKERLVRQLKSLGVDYITSHKSELAQFDQVFIVSGDHVFETETLNTLLPHCPVSLLSQQNEVVAVLVTPNFLELAVEAVSNATEIQNTHIKSLRVDAIDGFDPELRKTTNLIAERVSSGGLTHLESRLYGNAYKGVTDLVTKWLWPRLAKVAVRACSRAQISPNLVTGIGITLVIAATALFAQGEFVLGLLCGWLMTFLDTVDGKLARVTIQSSKLGHIMDHGIDILHPPFWYFYWGSAAAGQSLLGIAMDVWFLILIGGYVGGRIVEGVFPILGHCSIFAWRPFDAWSRLITARRNPCLIILTSSLLLGQPGLGFAAVTIWTFFSTAVLSFRLLQGIRARLRQGPLNSWLQSDEDCKKYRFSYRVFSRTTTAYD